MCLHGVCVCVQVDRRVSELDVHIPYGFLWSGGAGEKGMIDEVGFLQGRSDLWKRLGMGRTRQDCELEFTYTTDKPICIGKYQIDDRKLKLFSLTMIH